MKARDSAWGSRTWKAFLGTLLIYLAFGMFVSQVRFMQHREAFRQAKHPQNTTSIDLLAMRVSYYPATYVNDSIHFNRSAEFVGELRTYRGDWEATASFYDHRLVDAGTRILPIPVRFVDGQIEMDAGSPGAAFDPFLADVFLEIDEHYRVWGLPRGLNQENPQLYLVYSVWLRGE